MIRKAAPADVAGITRIFDEIHDAEERGQIVTGWIRGIYPTRQVAEDGVSSGEMVVFEEDGEILSSARINQEQVDVYSQIPWEYEASDREVMVLHTLVVSPRAQGKGIARQMLAFYEKTARENGCTVLRIDTNARNQVARAMYAKHGYREAGAVPCDFNGIPGVSLVGLEKKL